MNVQKVKNPDLERQYQELEKHCNELEEQCEVYIDKLMKGAEYSKYLKGQIDDLSIQLAQARLIK